MSLADHYRSASIERLLVTILTVDPANGRIEVVGKDAAVIQIGVQRAPALFRWPIQGENWTIIRENNTWALESKVQEPDGKQLQELAPGEALVQAETIWTPNGEYLVRSDQLTAAIAAAEVPLDTWHVIGAVGEPAFNAGWQSYTVVDPNWSSVAFRKDPFGRVYLRGFVRNNSGVGASGAMFTLPVGYRPPKYILFDAAVSGTSQGRVDVQSDGVVVCSVAVGNTAWITLDGLVFDTETVTTTPLGPAGPQGPPGGASNQVPQTYSVTAGYTADRTFNPVSTSLTETATILATLIDDMKANGLIQP